MIEASVIGKQLRYWSLHVGLCALPSFCLALVAFNSPGAIAGMLAGIATFVAGYTFVTSTTVYQDAARTTLLGRAVRKGTRIRVGLSLVSGGLFLGTFVDPAICMLAPDFWAGWGAIIIVRQASDYLGAGAGWQVTTTGSVQFLPTYLVTLVEGTILTLTLMLFAFFSLLVATKREARRQFGRQGEVRPRGD